MAVFGRSFPIRAVTIKPLVGLSAPAKFLWRTSGLDANHKDYYTTLINGIIADGLWTKLDILYVFATDTSSNALLNLVSPNYNAVSHGSPTFTANQGFTGTDSSNTKYLSTGFNTSTAVGARFAQTSAHMSVWNLTAGSGGTTVPEIGTWTQGSGAANAIWPLDSGSGFRKIWIQNPGTFDQFSPSLGSTIGFWFGNRSGTTKDAYWNSTNEQTGTQSAGALQNLEIYVLGTNVDGTPFGAGIQMATASVGSSFNATEEANFYTRLNTYLVSVGAIPVTLTASLVTDTDTFFQPTVAPGAVTLTASLITDTDTFFSPTAAPGSVTLTASLFDDTDTLYQPTVSATGSLVASLVSDTDTFYQPTVALSTFYLAPALFNDTDIFYIPSTDGSTTLTAPLYSDTDTFYQPTATVGDVSIAMAPVTSDDTFYAPTVLHNTTLMPSLVADTDTFYQPTATQQSFILLSLVTLSDTFFAPAITVSGIGLFPSLYTDTDTFYTPAVQRQTTQGGGGGGNGAIPADFKYATPFVTTASGLITALQLQVDNANVSAHTRMLIYADNTGVPGAQLAVSSDHTGITVGTVTYTLQTPYAVVIGTSLWITIHTDDDILVLGNTNVGSRYNADTFSDGSSNPFGASSVDNQKAPVLLVVLEAVTATIAPGLVSSDDTFYAPAATYSKTLTAPLLTDTDFFYSPSAVSGAPLVPSLYADTDTVFVPLASPGAVTLHPPYMTDDDATVIPVIGVGAADIKFPARLDDLDTIFQSTVTAMGANLLPSLVTDTDTFTAPSDVSVYHLADGVLLSAGESFFQPTVTAGSVTLQPLPVVEVDQFWIEALALGQGHTTPQLVQDGDLFYVPDVGSGLLNHSHKIHLTGAPRSSPSWNSSLTGIVLDGDTSHAQLELEGDDA